MASSDSFCTVGQVGQQIQCALGLQPVACVRGFACFAVGIARFIVGGQASLFPHGVAQIPTFPALHIFGSRRHFFKLRHGIVVKFAVH